MKSRYLVNRGASGAVLVCASLSFVVLLAIAVFTLIEALPAFREIGLGELLLGTVWRPLIGEFGIVPMIVGSMAVTFGAMVIAIPLGVACAILLAEVASGRIRELLRPAIELLVGIPSVVYGLVGIVLIVPLIRQIGGTGFSVAAASIVLAAMILPTIISISEDSLRAVPRSYKEGSLALGATQWQTVWRVMLPAARSGIIASIVLGVGRAVGETMAMIMVIGNSVLIPTSPLDPARTLTGTIAAEINYAAGLHRSALFAIGVVLFLFIIAINSAAMITLRRGGRSQGVC